MKEALPAHVTVSPEVLSRELEGEMVLLNLQNESYYGLDEVATKMWQLLHEDGDVEHALQELLDLYDVDEATLRDDMSKFLATLMEASLLVAKPAALEKD